jgi:hypothetical protein
MKQYCVGAPMERVALDLIGPLPLSHKGNKYVLIVSDYFTKWAEGYPIPDMETTTIVDNFVTNFVCRFGVPRQIHTDQGRQFACVFACYQSMQILLGSHLEILRFVDGDHISNLWEVQFLYQA